MAKTHLQGASFGTLSDGYVGRVMDKSLEAIAKDIDDRGKDGLTRTLTVTVKFIPQNDGRCKITTSVVHKLPAQQPPETIARLDHAGGGFLFNPDLAENPDQSTINDL